MRPRLFSLGSRSVRVRLLLLLTVAVALPRLAVPAWGVRFDPTVAHDDCLSRGGIPQFTPRSFDGFPASPGTQAGDLPLPNAPPAGHIGLVYTGCLLPDPPPGGDFPGNANIGPLIDLSLTGPRIARAGEDISARIHLSASNDGGKVSSTFTIQLSLASVSMTAPNVVNFPAIHSQGLMAGHTRTFVVHGAVIPADRKDVVVICGTTNPSYGMPVCFNTKILGPNEGNPVHTQ